MSDPRDPQRPPAPRPTRQAENEGSWTPPPPSSSPPPPAPTSRPVDTTGGIPVERDHTGSSTAPVMRGATVTLTPGLVLGLVAVILIVLGLFISESDGGGAPSANLWDRTSAPLWSIVAIVAAAVTLAPALRSVVNVASRPAWTAAAVAAGYLVFWWVLFVLPVISLNVAFLATFGVLAGVAAAWLSSDNPYREEQPGS